MDRGHQHILQDKHADLRRSLDVNGDLLAHLFSKGIITEEDIENEIKGKSGRDSATVLLQMLKTRGRTAFQSFHDALRDSTLLCNTALAELLRNAEKAAGMPATCFPGISSAKPVDGELAEPSQTPDRGTESVGAAATIAAAPQQATPYNGEEQNKPIQVTDAQPVMDVCDGSTENAVTTIPEEETGASDGGQRPQPVEMDPYNTQYVTSRPTASTGRREGGDQMPDAGGTDDDNNGSNISTIWGMRFVVAAGVVVAIPIVYIVASAIVPSVSRYAKINHSFSFLNPLFKFSQSVEFGAQSPSTST